MIKNRYVRLLTEKDGTFARYDILLITQVGKNETDRKVCRNSWLGCSL
jgi:hypothetical protein